MHNFLKRIDNAYTEVFSELRAEAPSEEDRRRIRELIRKILFDALEAKTPISEIKSERFPGGVASQFIGEIEATLSFAVKIDNRPELREQVETFNEIPSIAKTKFPEIMGAEIEDRPFLVVMENLSGYKTFHEFSFLEFKTLGEIKRATVEILDELFEIYETTYDKTVEPNLKDIYYDRIGERINKVRKQADFARILDKELKINGQSFEPINNYLDLILENLDEMKPDFSTFMHGDAHAENILLKQEDTGFDVRLVDLDNVKTRGDYIYDMGKFLHWPRVFGNIKVCKDKGIDFNFEIEENDEVRIEYSFNFPGIKEKSTEVLGKSLEKIEEFAKEIDDEKWEERLKLSEASALLGSPFRIMERWNDFNSAMVTYAEGVKRLGELKSKLMEQS